MTAATRSAHVSFPEDFMLASCSSASRSSPLASSSQVHASPSVERPAVIPLGPARTVALTRRGVIFSPQNATKYFNSDDSIIPDKRVPPPSIRQYHDLSSDAASPYDTPPLSRCSTRPPSEDPSLYRSILKQRAQEIRLAASVEEGTLHNKEPARLLVSGKRPRLMARDSFQLAMMRKAANDGIQIAGPSNPKGKQPLPDEVGSDDSSSSEDSAEREPGANEGSWDDEEEEEELEQDGALATASLVRIILDGAEDLLTLEEAYGTLTMRLRLRIPVDGQTAMTVVDARLATQPIRDEAPAMVRAMLRDLQRLLGKVPNAEVPGSDGDSPSFRGLVPFQDSTPVNRGRLTPSPTPTPANSKTSPDRPSRQGYTEAEVRYRREASGVGAAVLRFLAFVLHSPQLYSCFTEADLQGLLEQVMIIPRTPKLPTPNPKRTYLLSILIVAQIRIPASCVQPIKEKIARAVESALNDNLGPTVTGGPGGKEGSGQIRKEAFQAVTNLMSIYPAIFFQQYNELLPGCLRALTNSSPLIRNKASAAVAAFTTARYALPFDLQSRLLDPVARKAWTRLRQTVQLVEYYVTNHFKSGLRIPGKMGFVYSSTGEKRTEWSALEQVLKDTVGTTEVYWACATWAALVSLMGSSYSSSGLAAGFDHIMDRSLQPSANGTRPLLARIAWSHAIHAYLLSGSAISATDDGKLVQSWRPFAASSHQDVMERVRTLAMPVELALGMANDPNAASKVIEDGRYNWQRIEKPKKFSWMITCGLGAAALVYAYSGIALYHDDQPAKEVTAISGLPSSDGIPLPESTREENLMIRLDKTWDKVVRPMMVSINSICAVDKVKLHGWAILDAITAPQGPTAAWSLDKLLCTRYMNGEIFAFPKDDKETVQNDLLDKLDLESIRASDIPTWGSAWVTRNLESLLGLFQQMLLGVNGIADPLTAKWLRDEAGLPLIPLVISRIWSNIVRAVATIKHTPDFPRALGLLTLHLSQASERDPVSYFPLRSTTSEGHFAEDSDLSRLGLFTHLFDTILASFGPELVATLRLDLGIDNTTPEAAAPHGVAAYGSDASGSPTLAGYLLSRLLRESNVALPLSSQAAATLKRLAGKILDIGSVPGYSGKLLGDLTNQMPWIFQGQENVQLDIWRLLSLKWTDVIDLQPATTTSSTNHTGALLVSLLSGPFRGRQIDSVWHQHASQEDLEAWQDLLRVTVLRFRAKRVGSNLGVLENLAGHLGDFLEQGEKTSSTTITLSCLAAATSWIAFGPLEQHDTAHFSLNENFVPVEFLTLVSNALLESYPQTDSITTLPDGAIISPAVLDLITALHGVFQKLPAQFVASVLEPVRMGLSVWLADDVRIVNDEPLAAELDAMYITLLAKISEGIQGGFILATGETLDIYIDIYAPRLSRAQTPAVPEAFQSFWNASFRGVHVEEREDVKEFLGELLAAVPGMIEVTNLPPKELLSEEESQARFPNSESLRQGVREASPVAILVDQTTEIPVEDLPILGPSVEYDADISQSIEDGPSRLPTAGSLAPLGALASPNPSETESERLVSEETASVVDDPSPALGDVFRPSANEHAPSPSDVFGSNATETAVVPAAATGAVPVPGDVFGSTVIERPRRKGKAKRRSASGRSSVLTRARSAPEIAIEQVLPEARSVQASNSLPIQPTAPVLAPEQGAALSAASSSSSQAAEAIPMPSRRASLAAGLELPKPSLLSSATRWFRVPSLGGLFSPTRAEDESVSSVALALETDASSSVTSERPVRKARRTRKRDADGSMSEQLPSFTPPAPVAVPPSVKASRRHVAPPPAAVADQGELGRGKRRKRGKFAESAGTSASPIPVDEDDEDELLLSPESARQRKREEEGAIAQAVAQRSSISPRSKRSRETAAESQSQVSQGRFDDAPEDTDPAPTAGSRQATPGPSHHGHGQVQQAPPVSPLPSPMRRTAQQSRVMEMIEQATRAKSVIENLDFDGVMSLLRNVEELRNAAMANVTHRAEEGRQAKRTKRD